MVGGVLFHHFHWILYIFGVFLLFNGIKMLVVKEKEEHPEDNRWSAGSASSSCDETIFGFEIMDKKDKVADLQLYARNLWKERARKMGIEITDEALPTEGGKGT